MIKVESMYCSYGKKNILEDISFEVKKGEILNILGKNGVGKSTLFRSLLNILKYQGNYSIFGKDAREINSKNLSRMISYVPQSLKINFNHKVLDVVLMGYAPEIGFYQSPNEKQRQNAINVMKSIGIDYLKDKYFLEISGGEQQLVLIAKSMVLDTKILIMDEPLSSLDFGNQMKVLNQIKKLANNGMCILISTHNPMFAFLLEGKSMLLHDKKVMNFGNTTEVINSKSLTKLYDIDVEVDYIEKNGKKIGFCYPSGELSYV